MKKKKKLIFVSFVVLAMAIIICRAAAPLASKSKVSIDKSSLRAGMRRNRARAFRIAGFSLIDQKTNRPIKGYRRIKNGAVIDLAGFSSSHLLIRALVRPARARSIQFDISYNNQPSRSKEIINSRRRRLHQIALERLPGTYVIKATASARKNGRGQKTSKMVVFYLIDSRNPGYLTGVWANDGGDKVTKDELRLNSTGTKGVVNSLWNGSSINLFGAKNEIVSFNLILESAASYTGNVSVSFNSLKGPNGGAISSKPASGNAVFDYRDRNIELFYVRYLKIKGLSLLSYDVYDERHIPGRFRRPYSGEGYGRGKWSDRSDHDKLYPEIAVPLEAVGVFDIPPGENQSIWCDIYIPKTASAGVYSGLLNVTTNGQSAYTIPVSLTVRNFTLPDTPSSRTMVYLGYSDINKRYLGHASPQSNSEASLITTIRNRHFQLAHRHKISLIDENNGSSAWFEDAPRPEWVPRLDGTLFTPQNGYDGPGVGTGNGVFSVGTYGNWNWQGEGESSMRQHADKWENWFKQNSPQSERFLYLIDESSDYSLINKWALWLNNNPGPGSSLKSFATISIPDAAAFTPQLDIAAGWMAVGDRSSWQSGANYFINTTGKKIFMYNGKRPASGSFATEDDGIALRELPWGQYKKGIDRWFFWESTYYNNFQAGEGETNVYKKAKTFGRTDYKDDVLGETGWNYTNGDGVLFYPGIDKVFPDESYGLNGPIASLRLKYWRRGIQDVDYIVLANKIDSGAVKKIVDEMVPKVLWEYGIDDPWDPTWVRTEISWPTDPEKWEDARQRLADIIEGK